MFLLNVLLLLPFRNTFSCKSSKQSLRDGGEICFVGESTCPDGPKQILQKRGNTDSPTHCQVLDSGKGLIIELNGDLFGHVVFLP